MKKLDKLKNLGKVVTKAADGKLFAVHAVWPFDFFPDSVILHEDKLTHIHRTFFFIQDTKSLLISEISSVEVTSGPIFASATVYSKFVTTGEYVVKWLYKKDANKLRELANELMAANADQSGGQ